MLFFLHLSCVHSFSLEWVFPFSMFPHTCVWSLLVPLYVVSTTPRLPPQPLPRQFLQLLAQDVLSARAGKWQEAWVHFMSTQHSLICSPSGPHPAQECSCEGWLPPMWPLQGLLHQVIRLLPKKHLIRVLQTPLRWFLVHHYSQHSTGH